MLNEVTYPRLSCGREHVSGQRLVLDVVTWGTNVVDTTAYVILILKGASLSPLKTYVILVQ